MANTASWSLAGLLVVLCTLNTAWCINFNITSVIQAPFPSDHIAPHVKCDIPGICKPATVTLQGFQAMYWCGFYLTHKSNYVVKTINPANATKATSANLTTALFREGPFREHVLGDLSNPKRQAACPVILNSACSPAVSSCNKRVFGFAFEDPICLVVTNNRKPPITFTIRMNNYYSKSRYYGTVFLVVFVVLGALLWISALVIKCTSEWKYTTYLGGHNMNVNHLRQPILTDSEQGFVVDPKAGGSRFSLHKFVQLPPHLGNLWNSWRAKRSETAVRPRSG